jgi:predicted nucleic acid-binding protein
VILVETSAWVEFLRGTGTAVALQVRDLLGEDFAIADPVRMEVLAGARDAVHLRQLQGLLGRGATLATEARHYESAAGLYRTCRRRGETVRKLLDCLIAAVAIDADLPVLQADSDFQVLARHTPLRLA